MKEPKRKNKENLIGKIIYGFLLFMPLLAMAITCGYAIFNKNAYQSYYGENINDERKVNVSLDDLEQTKTYYVQIQNVSVESVLSNTTLYCSYIKNLSTNTEYDMSMYNRIRFFKNANTSQIYTQILRIDEGTSITISSNNTFEFTYISTNSDGLITQYLNFYEIEYVDESFMSEVFYYSIDKVEQSNLFNWSKDTGMYTTVHGATELLGITNTFIPMLMSYWLLINVIYIIYDIALIGVHMVHNKIHDFENVM